ncbi:M56 family metallopeptidase [bacterium]|nr:M56 family metallopeptidase [bacterium]MBU1024546.1 M56 family metallopeptidase [bacterium]
MGNYTIICLHQLAGKLDRLFISSSQFVLLIAGVFLAIGIVKAVLHSISVIRNSNNLLSLLLMQSKKVKISELGECDDNFTLNIYKDESPKAFTLGWMNPQIFISSELAAKFDVQKLNIIIQHEIGHCLRHDPLFYFIFSILRQILWFIPLSGVFVDRFKLNAEIACDNRAMQSGYKESEIANTLVDLARGLKFENTGKPVAAQSFDDLLELRVKTLMGENVKKMIRVPAIYAITSVLLIIIMFTSLTGAWYVSSDPYGIRSSILTASNSCSLGHKDRSDLTFFGIKCNHCLMAEQTESGLICHH